MMVPFGRTQTEAWERERAWGHYSHKSTSQGKSLVIKDGEELQGKERNSVHPVLPQMRSQGPRPFFPLWLDSCWRSSQASRFCNSICLLWRGEVNSLKRRVENYTKKLLKKYQYLLPSFIPRVILSALPPPTPSPTPIILKKFYGQLKYFL